jgi:hypothetical protein
VSRWVAIEITLPAGAKTLDVTVEDASHEWGGWAAVGEPHVMCQGECEAQKCPQAFVPGEVVPRLSGGFVDNAKQEGDALLLSGWAGDTKTGEAADHVIAVADGARIVACIKPDQDRPDVSSATGQPGLLKSGFMLKALAADRGKLVLYSRQSDGSLAQLNGQ